MNPTLLHTFVALACIAASCIHGQQTSWPRRHLLAPASKAEAALGDVHTPFSRADIPADVQSTVECKAAKTGSTPEPMVCIYKNVLLYKGVFHLVMTAKPAPEESWSMARMQAGGAKLSRYGARRGAVSLYGTPHPPVAPSVAQPQYSSRGWHTRRRSHNACQVGAIDYALVVQQLQVHGGHDPAHRACHLVQAL